jgi:L-arabinose transport system permease protein
MTKTEMPVATPAAFEPRPAPLPKILQALWADNGMLVVLALLITACAIFVPNFFSAFNFSSLLLKVSTVGIISCTMLFCMAAGDFDLSVGSVVAMGSVLAVVVCNRTGSVTLGIAAGTLAGGLVGLFNGIVIARLGINALIATLATMQIVRGVAFISCPGNNGEPVGATVTRFYDLGIGRFLGISSPVWIMFVSFIAFGVLLRQTTFGRNALAVGGNREAASLAGIRVTRVKIMIFTLQGLLAGFAGVILASRLTSGQPNTGQGLELQVISACVLGGVSLTGGVGTMVGVIIGVLIMGTVQNSMDLLNIRPFYQFIVSGGILLAAVLVDRLRVRR